jgi:regulatory protein
MNEKEALNHAMKLCSRKEYTTSEIKEKLLEWGVSGETTEKIVSELTADKFIDDSRYSHAFVNDKLKFSKWGRIKILYMLRQKGVAEEIATEAMNSIESDLYDTILMAEMVKKSKSIKAESPFAFRGKLIQFALQRGFEYETASRLADKIAPPK